MSSRWAMTTRTHPGLLRDHNEDACEAWAVGDGGVLAVCDGMGGMAQGEVASAAALEVFAAAVPALTASEAPYAAVFDALREADGVVHRATPRGGTTGVLAVLRGDRAWFGWVGDSRLYHARGGAILDRTSDHTQVAERVKRGELSAEEAEHHPDAHILANALGAGDARPEVFTEPLEIEPGDTVLLCSDGLTDLVDDAEIARACQRAPDAAADALVDLALERGGHDNITVVIARRLPPSRPTLADAPAPTGDSARAADDAPFRLGPPLWAVAAIAGIIGLAAGFALGRATAPEVANTPPPEAAPPPETAPAPEAAPPPPEVAP
jgi:serine/threonine protein phosphatase PrpC